MSGLNLADLVEEDRAAVGQLELAGLLAQGAGEGPLLVAEELGPRAAPRDGPAVHLDERAGPGAG